MIRSIQFKNFKVLRDTTLPLERFTLIVGPNGSGKSTALQALNPKSISADGHASFGNGTSSEIRLTLDTEEQAVLEWSNRQYVVLNKGPYLSPNSWRVLGRMRVFSLDPQKLVLPVKLEPEMELGGDGTGLAGVLEQLRDQDEDRFRALNDELGRVLPEFDRILLNTPSSGTKAFSLRTRDGHYTVPAEELSHGTLLLTALLTLAYLPAPPLLIGLEEPDRGIHPRLLDDIKDNLYRLSHPESFGESREPIQIVATTHSPYFLDLFRDHPEEIVIAQRKGSQAEFQSLTGRTDIDEILAEAPLGAVWYSGVLGGVPTTP